ncbi:hypothetical protein Rxycam_03049 [Rubrobacter xylanophilus DSM 9941]|nr:hypothetical protein Rxycam_03049 [Rubrobacter xylanophilus DSM 9941]
MSGLPGMRIPGRAREGWLERLCKRALETIYLVIGILGFFLVMALAFFGSFVLLDFLWGRSGGDP